MRALALNDDNHDTTYYFEDSFIGFSTRGFVKFLAAPHAANIDIRYVYLLEIPDDDIKAQNAFDVVDCCAMHMPWREAFDFLWDVYGKEW